MKSAGLMLRGVVVGAMVILFAGRASTGELFTRGEGSIDLDGRLNCPYISHNGGSVFLQITLTTRDHRPSQRRPMNIAVVLDRSGSMEDQGKMEHARKALFALIDELQSEDIFSLVVYDNVIDVLRPASRVGNKRGIKRLVDGIYPRGSTNLGGGMREGLRQVDRNANREFVNRVILLSDGLANQGITDPNELNRIARRYRSKSISLTTMGVGLDYNENLMVGLAESGGGNYYFIESSYGLTAMMRKEFNSLSTVLAQNASLQLTLGRGVRIIDVIGCEFRSGGETYIIPIGDLYANDVREFTVELQVPEGTGTLVLVRGSLSFERGEISIDNVRPFTARVNYTRDAAMIERNRDLGAQSKVDVAVSTRKVEQAMKALDEGRREEAEQTLRDAALFMSASPAASAGGESGARVLEQAERLKGYGDSLRESKDDTRKAKKEIQFDNYKNQKNK